MNKIIKIIDYIDPTCECHKNEMQMLVNYINGIEYNDEYGEGKKIIN